MLTYRITSGACSINVLAHSTAEAFERGFDIFGDQAGIVCICLRIHP